MAPKHVAFHLMPVYTYPHLLDGVSPALRKHLKGKTTFTSPPSSRISSASSRA